MIIIVHIDLMQYIYNFHHESVSSYDNLEQIYIIDIVIFVPFADDCDQLAEEFNAGFEDLLRL